jgi:O-methyltransferase
MSKNVYAKQSNLFEEVTETFKNNNVKLIKGAVPDTLNEINSDLFSFVSVDMNSAIPEEHAVEFIWPRMVKGGIIILDDY